MLGIIRWGRGFKNFIQKTPSPMEFSLTDLNKIKAITEEEGNNVYPFEKIKFQLNVDYKNIEQFSEYIRFAHLLIFKNILSDKENVKILEGLKGKKGNIETINDLNRLIFMLRSYDKEIDNGIIEKIVSAFIDFNKTIPIKLLVLISSTFSQKRVQINSLKFWDVFEDLVTFYKDSLNLSNFIFILKFNNIQILKAPNDLPTRLEPRICELVKTEEIQSISSIMQVYCGVQRCHHYLQLASAIYDRILLSPDKFFDTNFSYYTTTVHFFGKFRGFTKITELAEEYIPVITPEMRKFPAALGHYFQSILRKPGSEAYKNYIISQVIDHADHLEHFRKQKIIIAMVNVENELFWNNVKKLGVFWKADQKLFFPKEFEKLKMHGLINSD
jgi:hypothetical protein